MASGDVNYTRLKASRSLMDCVGGRLDLVDSTHIAWKFQNNNQIMLNNGSSWELCKCSTEPTIANTALDMNGTAQTAAPTTRSDPFAYIVANTDVAANKIIQFYTALTFANNSAFTTIVSGQYEIA